MARIETATEAHLPAILGIYNEVIVNSTAVYSFEPVSLQDRRDWLELRRKQGFPVLAALDARGEVEGFASYAEWRGAWPGYRHTVEHSVHVRADRRGQGVGRALLEALIPLARIQGKHVLIGGIDAQNDASIRLHEKLGFTRAAYFHQVGRKFDRWLDLVFMEKLLDADR